VIRVLFVDDHPAVRAGLMAVLRSEPGIVPVATASCLEDIWSQFNRTRPDLVLLDYHLPATDGLSVCRRLKRIVPVPSVLIYSAYADASMTIPAVLAGADGILHKGVPARELSEAIRATARRQRLLPTISEESLAAAVQGLETEDQPILGMMLAGTARHEVASTLRIAPDELDRRLDRMIERLRIAVPAAAATAPRPPDAGSSASGAAAPWRQPTRWPGPPSQNDVWGGGRASL
jgi:DNA-binding NarL/FixJ family response regulator